MELFHRSRLTFTYRKVSYEIWSTESRPSSYFIRRYQKNIDRKVYWNVVSMDGLETERELSAWSLHEIESVTTRMRDDDWNEWKSNDYEILISRTPANDHLKMFKMSKSASQMSLCHWTSSCQERTLLRSHLSHQNSEYAEWVYVSTGRMWFVLIRMEDTSDNDTDYVVSTIIQVRSLSRSDTLEYVLDLCSFQWHDS